MLSYHELMILGEKQRETGSIQDAIKTFNTAKDLALTSAGRCDIFCQLGLCYEHLGDLNSASVCYSFAQAEANLTHSKVFLARVLAHFAEIDLKRDAIIEALELATQAYALAFTLTPHPKDIVWLNHQLIKCMIAARYDKSVIAAQLKTEWRQYMYAWKSKETRLHLAVWATGICMDAKHVFPLLSWVFYTLGGLIAVTNGLHIRQKQAAKFLFG